LTGRSVVQVLIGFLILCFVLGGTRYGEPFLRRPVLLIIASVVVAASYYSLSVIQ
jgi:hypothetical protein